MKEVKQNQMNEVKQNQLNEVKQNLMNETIQKRKSRRVFSKKQLSEALFSYAATVIERCRLFSAVACCSAKNGENSPGLVRESERGGCGRQLMRGGNRIS